MFGEISGNLLLCEGNFGGNLWWNFFSFQLKLSAIIFSKINANTFALLSDHGLFVKLFLVSLLMLYRVVLVVTTCHRSCFTQVKCTFYVVTHLSCIDFRSGYGLVVYDVLAITRLLV